jgi:hypothetical protein
MKGLRKYPPARDNTYDEVLLMKALAPSSRKYLWTSYDDAHTFHPERVRRPKLHKISISSFSECLTGIHQQGQDEEMPEICLEGRIPKHVFNTYLASINVYFLLIQKLPGRVSPLL